MQVLDEIFFNYKLFLTIQLINSRSAVREETIMFKCVVTAVARHRNIVHRNSNFAEPN